MGKAALLVEDFEVLFDGVGASRAGEIERVTVAVVDTKHVVGRRNHVEIEICA